MDRHTLTLRRMRQNRHVRELARETRVSREQLVQPLFAVDGISSPEPISGMTGVMRETPVSLLKTIERDLEAGTTKFLLFGVPARKAASGFDFSFTAGRIADIKKHFGEDLFLAVDICLCSATTHGQCGILSPGGDHVENNATVEELARAAGEYAAAGADCVAPSDMMDGRVAAIRENLDRARLERTLVMSYSAKFCSRFYGPFREAADSAPKGDAKLKDRTSYQIDPARYRDALMSSRRDDIEGADILMVKPGLPYLDVLSRLSLEIPKPWAVYEVSGEYAAVELMAGQGLMDGPAAHVECWTSFVRAGASMIITYGARKAGQWL